MGFHKRLGRQISDPFGTKRRGKKKREAATRAAAANEASGEVFQERITGVQEQLTTAGESLREQTDRAASVFDPFIRGGEEALETKLSALGVGGREFDASILTNSPQFQFAQQQGLQAGERALGAAGLGKSGRAAKELARFSSGLASNTFGSFLNNLSGIIEGGRGAAGQQAQTLLGGAGIQAGVAGQQAQIGFNAAQVGLGVSTGATDTRLAGQLGAINAAGANVSNLVKIGTQIVAGVATGGASLAVSAGAAAKNAGAGKGNFAGNAGGNAGGNPNFITLGQQNAGTRFLS